MSNVARLRYISLMHRAAIFNKIYADLPLSLRSEIIVVLDNEPLTWNSAKIEIDGQTEKGKIILEKLYNMGIIKDDKETN